jgi:hypothetical protein
MTAVKFSSLFVEPIEPIQESAVIPVESTLDQDVPDTFGDAVPTGARRRKRGKRGMHNPYATERAAHGEKAMSVAAYDKLPDASSEVANVRGTWCAIALVFTFRVQRPQLFFAPGVLHAVAFALAGVKFVTYSAVAALMSRPIVAALSGMGEVFIGQLPRDVPEWVVAAIVWLASGCPVYGVSVKNTDTRKVQRVRSDGRPADDCFSASAFVRVARGDLMTVVTALHKRVLLDRFGIHVAVNAQGIDLLDKLRALTSQPEADRDDVHRIQCAPYQPVTACKAHTSESAYLPLCECAVCAAKLAATTGPEFERGFTARRDHVLLTHTPAHQVWCLPLEHHMKSSAYIEETLQAVHKNVRRLWPQWQNARRDNNGPRSGDAGRIVLARPMCDAAVAAAAH